MNACKQGHFAPDDLDSNSIRPSPLISIALCVYNGEAYLAQQLASLRAQTWPKLELVVIDDASTDGSLQLLQAQAQQDARIRIYRNDSNLGFAASFSKALSLCQGDLISPCDQDDIWHPEKLAKLQARLGANAMVYCDSALVDADGASLGACISDRLAMYEGNDPRPFTFWNCVSGHAMLFPATLLKRALPMPAVKFHDWWLAFVAASVGGIAYLDEPLVRYRQHKDSQTDVIRRKRSNTDSARNYHERAAWLAALASFQSPHRSYFVELSRLWGLRETQWFCPALVRHLHSQSAALMAINKRESFVSFARKQFIGLKAKQLFAPKK